MVVSVGDAVVNTDWMQIWGNIAAALLGAVIGGAVTWLVNWQMIRADRAREGRERAERAKAAWITTMYKATAIEADLNATVRAIEGAREKAERYGLTAARPWQKLPGFAARYTSVTLDPRDVLPLIEAKQSELGAVYSEIVTEHQQLVSVANSYSDKISELIRLVPSEYTAEGTLAPTKDAPPRAVLEPRLVELDQLALILMENAPKLLRRVRALTLALGETGSTHFKDSDFPRPGRDSLGGSSPAV